MLGFHRQFKGELEIKMFLTIFHWREGEKREREEEQRQGGREEEREAGNWGHHYKHLHFARRR